MSIFQNPMMLMMGFSLIVFFVLPKITGHLDPETLKEIQESQRGKKNVANAMEMPDISQNLANWLTPK